MKASRTILTVILVVLLVVGWASFILSTMKTSEEYEARLCAVNEYLEQHLYQKAVAECENALSIRESVKGRRALLGIYELGCRDNSLSENGYIRQLQTATELYPEEVSFWEKLLTFQVENSKRSDAYDTLKKLKRESITSEVLDELRIKVLYSYTVGGNVVQQVLYTPERCLTVCDDDEWGVLTLSGETFVGYDFEYISPVSQNAVAAYNSEDDVRLMDGSQIVEGYLKLEITETRAYGDGYLPVKTNNGWQYYSVETEKYVLETYEEASAFLNGTAAVLKDGVWTLIGTDGVPICSTEFSDIKLYDNGDYTYGNIMVAAENGQYGIYNAAGEKICDFACDNADLYMGSWIAYEENGQWGYVTTEGKIGLTPQYEKARSFSNGLAAVSVDGLWGFIDGTGTVVIDPVFVEVGYFLNSGKCFVCEIERNYKILTLRYPEGI